MSTRAGWILLIMVALTGTILALIVTVQIDDANAARTEFMPCATDEGDRNNRDCVWDAKHQGNGQGHSLYFNKQGESTRIPHSIAHYLIYGSH